MNRSREEMLAEADALEKRAREVEGDSDSPLRVSASNSLWNRAARLRYRAALRTHARENDRG